MPPQPKSGVLAHRGFPQFASRGYCASEKAPSAPGSFAAANLQRPPRAVDNTREVRSFILAKQKWNFLTNSARAPHTYYLQYDLLTRYVNYWGRGTPPRTPVAYAVKGEPVITLPRSSANRLACASAAAGRGVERGKLTWTQELLTKLGGGPLFRLRGNAHFDLRETPGVRSLRFLQRSGLDSWS